MTPNPIGQSWDWFTEQCAGFYALAIDLFVALDLRVQAAIVAIAVIVGGVVTLRMRETGVVAKLVTFALLSCLLVAVGVGVAYLLPEVMNPDSVIRHPVPRMSF